MKKILHICPDEKFIDSAINNFTKVKNVSSDFVVVTKNRKLKYVKSKSLKIKSFLNFAAFIFINRLSEYDAVVFHSLPLKFKFLLHIIPKRLTICWVGFGFDYYERSKTIDGYIEKESLKKKVLNFFYRNNSIYKRIDYFSPVIESEFDIVKKKLNLKANYIDWNYGSSNNTIYKLKDEFVDSDAILLGNSADENNNHIIAINNLIELNVKNEVIIPLSYGGSPEYINDILLLLKSSSLNYTVLTDFMSQSEYFNLVKKCSFVIMNHKRQQAAGNIVLMLSLGAKIFLEKENPLYEHLKKQGFKVYSNESLDFELKANNTFKYALKNKNLALKLFNDQQVENKTNKMVNVLLKE